MYPRTRIAVRSVIAVIQLIGGLLGMWILFVLGDGNISGPIFWFFLAFVGSIAGAVLLWKSPYQGILVSLAVQAAQLPFIETPTTTYRLEIGLGAIFRVLPFQLAGYSYGTSYSYRSASGSLADSGVSTYGLNVAALLIFGLLLVLLAIRIAEPQRPRTSDDAILV